MGAFENYNRILDGDDHRKPDTEVPAQEVAQRQNETENLQRDIVENTEIFEKSALELAEKEEELAEIEM